MDKIRVWHFNSLNNEWFKKTTEHYKETKDENNYFRLISNCEKHFYSSFEDFYQHNLDYINQELITDVNGNILHNEFEEKTTKQALN